MKNPLKVFLVDDEPLALKRLSRLLSETAAVEVVGQTSAPREAAQIIPTLQLDALFLDIQMPELTGFELLRELKIYPPVIFTTAFDRFALQAFEVYSVDYLLKPIESERLAKALERLERIAFGTSNEATANVEKLLANLLAKESTRMLDRLASRIGGKIQILEAAEIAQFFAEDKMTFARRADGRNFPLDSSLNELESRLDARDFLRVHRNSIVNLNFIKEVHGWFSGRVLIKLKGEPPLEVVVARDRVKILKDFLGM